MEENLESSTTRIRKNEDFEEWPKISNANMEKGVSNVILNAPPNSRGVGCVHLTDDETIEN